MSILLPGNQSLNAKDPYPVYARSGWEIPQQHRRDLPKISLEQMRIKAREWRSWREKITVRSVSPYPYNCMGLIFASRRAFIDIDHIYDILKADGYKKIALRDIVTGDVVLYRNYDEPSHVALVVSVVQFGQTINVKVISKWGLDPEFEHFMEDVPAQLGKPTEFYTERE